MRDFCLSNANTFCGIGHADSRKKQLSDVLRKHYRGQVVLVKGNRLFVSLAYDVNI